jgi:hypothetical protein
MIVFAVTGPKDTLPVDVHAVTFPDYERFLKYIYASEANKEEAEEV